MLNDAKAVALAKLGKVEEAIESARDAERKRKGGNILFIQVPTIAQVAVNLPKRLSKETDALFDKAQQVVLANDNEPIRNRIFIQFIEELIQADRLDRAVELLDAIDSENVEPYMRENARSSHAALLGRIAEKLLEHKKRTEAIELSRKSLKVCLGLKNEQMILYPLSLALQVFHDTGDGEGAAEVLDALSKTSRGPDADDFWKVAAALRAQKDEHRAQRDPRTLLETAGNCASPACAGKPEPPGTDFRRTSAKSPAERLPIAVAEAAETHVRLGHRAEAFARSIP